MVCKTCGTDNVNNTNYCPNCGVALSEEINETAPLNSGEFPPAQSVYHGCETQPQQSCNQNYTQPQPQQNFFQSQPNYTQGYTQPQYQQYYNQCYTQPQYQQSGINYCAPQQDYNQSSTQPQYAGYLQSQQYYASQQNIPPQSNRNTPDPAKGKKIASVILGGLSCYFTLLSLCTCFANGAGVFIMPAALVLSIIGSNLVRQAEREQTYENGLMRACRTLNKVGLIISIIGTILFVVLIIAVIIGIIGLSLVEEMSYYI